MKKLGNYDWYCNECNSLLNKQPGFYAECGIWICSNCGETNSIREDDVLSYDELEAFEESGFESYNQYVENRDSNESYSVQDAALAWLSSGKDEGYMFGYTEEELENALEED